MDSPLSEIRKAPRRAPLRALRRSTAEVRVADETSKTGAPDRQVISTTEPYQLRDWARNFGVTEDALRAAISQVGVRAQDVERYLKDKAKR